MSSRNRINHLISDHPFVDYWDIFICKHQDWRNIVAHLLGIGIAYVAFAGFLVTWNWWWLALVPLSQAIGLLGHYFFERSHVDTADAVFTWRATMCLNRLLFHVVRGSYGDEVTRVNGELQAYLSDKATRQNQNSSQMAPERHSA